MEFAHDQRFGQWTLKGENPLGEGGNGEVWLAENAEGIKAAIKFLHSENFGVLREMRFRDEIQFLADNPKRLGVLPLIDFHLPHVSTEQDRPWFTTPLATCFTDLELAGVERLEGLIRKIEAVARTLVKLHEGKNYHRDLKAENLFLLNEIPVIGDFGLVDFPDKNAKTRKSEAIGSRNYTAPELEANAMHTPADKADVYSLSKTLWVIATGKPPPQGTLRMDERELRFSNHCPHLLAGFFDSLLEKGTAQNQDHRPTMLMFADELSEWLNPPSHESVSTDLTILTKGYENIFEIQNRAERKRDELMEAAKSTLSFFDPVLNEIAERITEHTRTNASVGYAYDLERYQFKPLFRGVRLVSGEAKGVRVTIGEVWAAFLQSFVQVEALDNDTIRIVTGHLAETTANGKRFYGVKPVWIKEVTARQGSAELANESNIFRIELLNNLGPAICAFGECVKNLSK